MALISVIVPVYNNEAYLPQCIESILAQTLTDLELILVDDGSPDRCGAICDEYAARDARVRVIHKENGGTASAWMAGVRAAGADYLGFADSDDWLDPDYYRQMYAAAREHGADMVQSERVEETADGPVVFSRERTEVCRGMEQIRPLIRAFFTDFLDKPKSLWPVTYSRCDKLYRRALVVDCLPFINERWPLNEDRTANAAILADCETVVLLASEAKYHYRFHPGSLSTTYEKVPVEWLEEFASCILAVAKAKGLDEKPVSIYLGSNVYQQIYFCARRKGVSMKDKRALIRRMLACCPADAPVEYAKARDGAFLRLFCGLLRRGAIGPCVALVTVHDRLARQRSGS